MITEVIQELERRGLEYQLLPHERTQTARAEANAVGIAPSDVAKTVVLTTEDGYVRAVVPASERLDLTKARDLLDDRHSKLATEEELGAAYPTFELGAVAPFGGPSGDRVIVEARAERDVRSPFPRSALRVAAPTTCPLATTNRRSSLGRDTTS
jgi:Ala-tRNA(Pro) deacylase